MTDIIELTTTTETEEQARQLGRLLVESKLAACVQITGPIHSIYRWQGKICESSEFRCTAKSTQSLCDRIMQAIQRHHPYDTPEILITNVAVCSPSYAQWLQQQVEA